MKFFRGESLFLNDWNETGYMMQFTRIASGEKVAGMRADTDHSLIRHVYRGLKEPVFFQLQVDWGGVETADVPAGALISVTNVDGGGRLLLTARGPDDRHFTTRPLDVPAPDGTQEYPGLFDRDLLTSLASARGSSLDLARYQSVFDGNSLPGDQFVTRALEDTTLYVIAPMDGDYVSECGGSSFSVSIKPPEGRSQDSWLPAPLGKVRDEWRVSRGSAKAYEVKKGPVHPDHRCRGPAVFRLHGHVRQEP